MFFYFTNLFLKYIRDVYYAGEKRDSASPIAHSAKMVIMLNNDIDFVDSGRDALYYARALQLPTPAVNEANLPASNGTDNKNEALSLDPCYGDYRTEFDDDCLAPVPERAWSSPIFVNQSP